MGKLSRGFLGGFQGQLGTAYGCFWRMMDLIKAMPRKSNRPPTSKQLDVQAKFTLMAGWLGAIGNLIKFAYFNKKSNQSAMNAAVAYNIENAITGVAPNYTIDYAKVLLSTGALEEPYHLGISTDEDAEIEFNWELHPAGTINSNPTDKLSFVIYNPAKQKFVMLLNVVNRSALTYAVALPVEFSGDNVHPYVVVVNEERTLACKTKYAGATVVQ
ncbi:MAG: DUF6266 family protein [Bacteroidota bacterium]